MVAYTLVKDEKGDDDNNQESILAFWKGRGGDRFSQACKDFGMTMSLKKTEVFAQDTDNQPKISVDDYELKAVNQFTYLGSTISSNISLDAEIDKRIGKAATTLARLTSRVWENPKLTIKTKIAV